MSGTIHHETSGTVITIWLDNPGKLNAISVAMWEQLAALFQTIHQRDDLRCVVIRGSGSSAFGSGADIDEFESVRSDKTKAVAFGQLAHSVIHAIEACPIPVLAAIQGICVGGGLEVAAVCDLRLCTDNSRFGIPVARLGATLAYQELQGLYRLVGPAVALELLLEGRILDATEAASKGLVTRVVQAAVFEEEVTATVKRLTAGAPLSARWHKKFVRRLGQNTPLSDTEWDEGFACFDTEDYQIGYRSFLQKTTPQFIGR